MYITLTGQYVQMQCADLIDGWSSHWHIIHNTDSYLSPIHTLHKSGKGGKRSPLPPFRASEPPKRLILKNFPSSFRKRQKSNFLPSISKLTYEPPLNFFLASTLLPWKTLLSLVWQYVFDFSLLYIIDIYTMSACFAFLSYHIFSLFLKKKVKISQKPD